MITISINDLRDFISKAKHIKAKKILPIYDYVKLVINNQGATIYKSNGEWFIKQDIEATSKEPISVLIEESTIHAALLRAEGDSLFAEVTEKQIERKPNEYDKVQVLHITDSSKRVNLKSQGENPNLYPKLDLPTDATKTLLPSEFLESLFFARAYCQTEQPDILNWLKLVQVKQMPKVKGKGATCVFGSMGMIFYFRKFAGKLPEMMLDPDVCAIISSYQTVEHSTYLNYDYFDTGKTVYGFLKTEVKAQEFLDVVDMLDNTNHFTVEKKDLLDFCEVVSVFDTGKLMDVISIDDDGKNKIMLRFDDDGRDRHYDQSIKAEGKNFKLTKRFVKVSQLLRLLKNCPYEKLTFSGPVSYTYFITTEEDADYVGAIREVAYN
jgi:hypothetical protein